MDLVEKPAPAEPVRPVLLVVDDDPTTGPLIKAALRGDFDVSVEMSGARAIEQTAAISPRAVLLDLHMPNIDGYEVLRQLAQNPLVAGVPVICMSGDSDESSRNRAYDLGGVGYLTKPLSVKSLGKDVQTILGGLNLVMESPSKNRVFSIAFNGAEKLRLVREAVNRRLTAGRKVLLLSMEDGATFCGGGLREPVVEKRLVFLQVTTGLIAKFPYLQDLSPILTDIHAFLDSEGLAADYDLVFDDPSRLVDLRESKTATTRLRVLDEALASRFPRLEFHCAREASSEANALLKEAAAGFCR